MEIDGFLAMLEGVRKSGGQHIARCPAHDDNEASLTVREAEGGKILVHCHAGCATEDIVLALDLNISDLMGKPRSARSWGEPLEIYRYEDEVGRVLFEVLRYEGKRFRQRHNDPSHPDAKKDGWVWNLEGVRRVPYHLPQVLAAVLANQPVYIAEGEKDVDRLIAETGRCATCNPMGAGKWRPEFARYFEGARVCIVQDKDEPGRRHALGVQEALGGIAAEVRLRQSANGKDISNHFDSGMSLAELATPRAAPSRGIVTAAQMADAGKEYLTYTPEDLPSWELVPGLVGTQLRGGRLYTLGGYTGDGKTAFSLQGIRNLCADGARVGYFSMEMTDVDLRNRLVQHKGVPLKYLERPWEMADYPDMRDVYLNALDEIRGWQLDIIYDTNLKPARVVKETYDREYELVVIDHIHRFGWKERRDLEEHIATLTNLALDANIPVLVLCQLRRYQRSQFSAAYPPPGLQDFRETEMLGNESSLAFAIWRTRADDGLSYLEGGTSQFRVLKNRHPTVPEDRSGYIEVLDFDPLSCIYSRNGIGSE